MHMALFENTEQESMCVLVTAAHSNKNMRGYLLLGGGYHITSLKEEMKKECCPIHHNRRNCPCEGQILAVALTTLR